MLAGPPIDTRCNVDGLAEQLKNPAKRNEVAGPVCLQLWVSCREPISRDSARAGELSHAGTFRLKAEQPFLSNALADEHIGLE